MIKMRKTLLVTAVMSCIGISSYTYAHAPIDMGVVNEEKLIEMLVRKGVVDRHASDEAKHRALKAYLAKKSITVLAVILSWIRKRCLTEPKC